jgi:hypothetical protein
VTTLKDSDTERWNVKRLYQKQDSRFELIPSKRALLFSFFFFFIFVFRFSVNAEIFEIQNISQCEPYIQYDSFVIFDLDNTVMEPAQVLGSDQWFSYRIKEHLWDGMSEAEACAVALAEWTSVQLKTSVRPVEPDIVAFIKHLQKRDLVVMGLTLRGLNLAAKTLEQLQSIGVDFSKTYPITGEINFKNSGNVLCRRGVIFSNGTDKGALLLQFFQKSGFFPKRVLFIDDKEKHLQDVERICAVNQIPFIGLRYGFLDEKVKNSCWDLAGQQWNDFGKELSVLADMPENRLP